MATQKYWDTLVRVEQLWQVLVYVVASGIMKYK